LPFAVDVEDGLEVLSVASLLKNKFIRA